MFGGHFGEDRALLSRLMYKIGTHRGPCGKVHGPKSVNKIGNSAMHAADVSLAHTIFRACSKTLIKIDHFVTQATSAFNASAPEATCALRPGDRIIYFD